MTPPRTRPAYGALLMMAAAVIVGVYFALAAVQGEYGLFRQVQIASEQQDLTVVRCALEGRADFIFWPANRFGFPQRAGLPVLEH